MALTPLEFRSQEFKKSIRGYRTEDVDRYVEKITRNYEELYKENNDLREQIEQLNEAIQRHRNLEATLNNTLIVAQQVAEDRKTKAEQEAVLILREAELKAEKLMAETQAKLCKQVQQLEEIKKQEQLFRARLKSLLKTHLEVLDQDEKSFQQAAATTELLNNGLGNSGVDDISDTVVFGPKVG